MTPDRPPASKHVFISFSSRDREKAASLCESLEREGQQCWISLRDVQPGQNYQAAIVDAIASARAMVLVFSSTANRSEEISKELALASASRVPVVPFRIEDVLPEGAFRYELATRQWVDAFANWEVAVSEVLRATGAGSSGEALARPPVRSPDPARSPASAQSTIPVEALEAARAALAHYVGPIAMVLVRKAAAQASSLEAFHERLERHVTAEDRAAFRTRLRRSPGAAPRSA